MQTFGGASWDLDPLNETMTVNRVLHDHPETKAVFDRLYISSLIEGCDYLDQVAWYHGMESRELLEQLKQAIALEAEPPAVHAALN